MDDSSAAVTSHCTFLLSQVSAYECGFNVVALIMSSIKYDALKLHATSAVLQAPSAVSDDIK